MKRTVFIILSVISALVCIGSLMAMLNEDTMQKISQYLPGMDTGKLLITMGISGLLAVICYIVQSVMKDLEWKRFQKEHPEQAEAIRQQKQIDTANSVTDYDFYQLSELQSKIGSILGRGVFAALLSVTGVGVTASYLIISYCWFFIRLTRNYLIGLIAAVLSFYALLNYADRLLKQLPEKIGNIVMFMMFFGIFIIDIVNIIRYLVLKGKIKKAGIAVRKLSKEEMRMYRTAK